MPKRSTKSKSKRKTLKQKYKILKKVKEHHRKKRKDLKKIEAAGKKKTPKDPGIPTQWPFRDQLIQELQQKRLDVMAEEERKKEERRQRAAGVSAVQAEQQGGMEGMQARALARASEYDLRTRSAAPSSAAGTAASLDASDKDNSRRAFYKEFKKVVELADVIIQVLDARDPLACRCGEVERYIRTVNPDKKIILLLNKIDLVPREVVEQWLKYFREELPCVAFKCSTQKQATHLGQRASSLANAEQGSECLGAETLLQLLKNFARNKNIKTAITVGIIGLPNTGKSSLINSLVRTRAVQVGNMPGVTKQLQEVHLDKHVKLLDSPGIVFTAASSDGAAALRNCLKVEKLSDPVTPVGEIFKRVPAKQLMVLYKLPAFQTPEHFLAQVAKSRGKLFKGGAPDLLAAARVVLTDWNNGKIPYFTLPPKRNDGKHDAATIVSAWGAEFDANAVFAAEKTAVIAGLPSMEEGLYVQTEGLGAAPVDLGEFEQGRDGKEEREDAALEMDHDVDDLVAATKARQMRKTKGVTDHANRTLYGEVGQYNPKAARAEKKRRKKGMDEEMDDDEFDFEEAFGEEEEEEEEGEEEEEEDMSGSEEGDSSDEEE